MFNTLELVEEVWYTINGIKQIAYGYEYTADGQISEFRDYINDTVTVYTYLPSGRLASVVTYDFDYYGAQESLVNEVYYYNAQGQMSSTVRKLGSEMLYAEMQSTYLYNEDGSLSGSEMDIGNYTVDTDYTYDNYGRLTRRSNDYYLISNSSTGFYNEIAIEYAEKLYSTETCTKSEISKYTSNIGEEFSEYSYEYDESGNITKVTILKYSKNSYTNEISVHDSIEIEYVYDNLGQLIREDNGQTGYTYIYEYDKAGNITERCEYSYTTGSLSGLTPISTISYLYENSNWGDRLTSYNGSEITYDIIGNPLEYYNGYTFSWSCKLLTGAVILSDVYSFTYDDNGMRTSKTKDGVKTTYYLSGTTIVGEETNGNLTLYIYDDMGAPIGFRYHGSSYASGVWDTYWYEKNLHGDIVGIYNAGGTLLISYAYNAYGRATTSYHNGGAATTATKNPFKYRGYYYDQDLGLYYLQTRYYDPYVGRFISPDDVSYLGANGDLLSYNLYAYCSNNPVMYVDPTGEWKWLKNLAGSVADGYRKWKKESFIYNVILSNSKVELGFGIGMGGAIEIGSLELAAISRMDIVGFEMSGFDPQIGHFGKSAFSAGVEKFSIGGESNTYESFDGNKPEPETSSPEITLGVGSDFGFVFALRYGASVSLSGIYKSFVSYGKSHSWW